MKRAEKTLLCHRRIISSWHPSPSCPTLLLSSPSLPPTLPSLPSLWPQYLSGGCGAPGGFFVHERHARSFDIPRLVGWWAHKMDTRFVMDNSEWIPVAPNASVGPGALVTAAIWCSPCAELDLIPGAGGFQVSNPSPFAAVGCVAALEVGSTHVHLHAHTHTPHTDTCAPSPQTSL